RRGGRAGLARFASFDDTPPRGLSIRTLYTSDYNDNVRRMEMLRMGFIAALALAWSLAARAADYPAPREADWIAKDFRFHTGESLPEVRLHYATVGAPGGEPVLILHGTGGSHANFLTKDFAGELFGPGQPLDAARYFIILPDALGTGKSTRPS